MEEMVVNETGLAIGTNLNFADYIAGCAIFGFTLLLIYLLMWWHDSRFNDKKEDPLDSFKVKTPAVEN